MNEVVKKSKNVYRMGYEIKVPVSDGLKQIFQLAEELRSEFGMEPADDYITVNRPCKDSKDDDRFELKALVRYSRQDALRVLNDSMSEEEYIKRHIGSLLDEEGKIFTDGNSKLANISIADIL